LKGQRRFASRVCIPPIFESRRDLGVTVTLTLYHLYHALPTTADGAARRAAARPCAAT
jgi:hypothetical protein